MCDKMYSKRLAFNYLEDIAQEFHKNYGRKVNSVTRPYAFIEFDVYIQKAKKQLTDRRRNINAINNQLQDVQRIMVRQFYHLKKKNYFALSDQTFSKSWNDEIFSEVEAISKIHVFDAILKRKINVHACKGKK